MKHEYPIPLKHVRAVRSNLSRKLILMSIPLMTGWLGFWVAPVFAQAASPALVISEFMASNGSSLVDEDGETSDWLEIYNQTTETVSLAGMYLTDNPDQPPTWRFPAISLDAGAYLVVFASGKDRSAATGELHTDFRLEAAGEYLGLIAPDGVTVIDEIAPAYPEQLTDVSYGISRWSAQLVGPGSEVMYHVPDEADSGLNASWQYPDFIPSGWNTGAFGLGFSNIAPEGFEVTCIKARTSFWSRVWDLDAAKDVLENPDQQEFSVTEFSQVINYFNSAANGNYSNDLMFPGLGSNQTDDFVVLATGTILIPEAGEWSFGVNSDDGFELILENGVDSFLISYPDPRGAADTIETCKFTQAGPCDVRLLYYERGGGAEVEFFAAKGTHSGFNYDDFRLVGDVDNGGLGFSGYAGSIVTDVSSGMSGVNASIWTRTSFTVDDTSNLGQLFLNVFYEDGFIAYLNGEKVAERNAPESPAWNSTATADRQLEDISVPERITLDEFLPLLQEGDNILAIHGLNDTAEDSEFLINAELIAVGNETSYQYMENATPGALNASGVDDFVRDVQFSVEHGFYESPFSLELFTVTESASIRYTLDGSTPTPTNGIDYSGSIGIDETTCVRAVAFRQGYIDSNVRTQTYFFLDDILTQSPNGESPGPGWPSGNVNGQMIDYGMDPDIVNGVSWKPNIKNALLDIPTISLVTDLDNLFGSSSGIYVNAGNDGRAWERETSAELINPDGTEGFSVNAGLRIRGAFSRSDGNPKHSFRLFFRNEYGPGRLQYPLFGNEGADEFDKVDLRTSQNYSWAFEGSEKNTFLRDVFSRDVQREMGQPYSRSRYYHLYLNGHYWGLYQTQERVDADYAESYLGGSARQYDVIKNDSSGNRELQATDGNMDAYRRLYDAAVAGFESDAAYLRLLGLNPDGTPDPNGEVLLDPDNLMDYMVCTYYTGDPDAPISCWGHFSNNVFAVYNRENPAGFTWYRHDAEHSLGANGGLYEGRLLTDPTDRSIGQEWRHFNPAWLHLRLTENDEYRMRFADRVAKDFFNDGILSPQRNIDRWMTRSNEIDLAIIAESARWGDAKTNPPRTKSHWLLQQNYMVRDFFPQRTQIVINQMRSVDMFPDQAIVVFNQPGGPIDPGFEVVLSQENGDPGIIYYTLDGTDPRMWGGAIHPLADIYDLETSDLVLTGNTVVKARVYDNGEWGALSEAWFSVGSGGLVINELMAINTQFMEDPDEAGEFPDWFELMNTSAEMIDLGGMYMTDDPADLTKWRIAAGTRLLPGERLLIYADEDPSQGFDHADFRLNQAGETLYLIDTDGSTMIHSITFGQQYPDISYGRYPDGEDQWGFHAVPTPGTMNEPLLGPNELTVDIVEFSPAGDQSVILGWASCQGCRYQVLWTDDLAAGNWMVLGTITAETDPVVVEVPLPPGPSQGFLQVIRME